MAKKTPTPPPPAVEKPKNQPVKAAAKKVAPPPPPVKAAPKKVAPPPPPVKAAAKKVAPPPPPVKAAAKKAAPPPVEDEAEVTPVRPPAKKAAAAGGDDELKRLTPKEIKEFCEILQEKRKALIESARDTLLSQEDLEVRAPDEVDQATTEYDQSFEYRMRDREKFLLRKIEKALARMDEGEYDLCEGCGNPIGRKRLMARPETTYCIVCKEEQERQEKMFQKKRQMRATLEF